jgi:isocitrate/isopropylmalate dehydrogenase
VHGTAPDIAGKGIANPLACIMSGVMMLNYVAEARHDEGCHVVAARIKAAYDAVLGAGKPAELTRDLGGSAGTKEFTAAILGRIK